ncbi:MAG: glycosyltransferase [Chitinophagales bacterium]
MFHSYVLFPFLLWLFSRGKKENELVYAKDDADLPEVFVVFAAYNEEKVILEKMQSIFNTAYPKSKLHVFIGSDNSTDQTNEIITSFPVEVSELFFLNFEGRMGKSAILNQLVSLINKRPLDKANTVFVFTDANVMFTPETLFQLAKHFKNPSIGQVAANILNRGVTPQGIAYHEKSYINRENRIKYLEGLNGGAMIGAFGACYAMRADCWTDILPNYLMEDFYLSMGILKQDKKAILEPNAICHEDVSSEVQEEYKRKKRIQAGNFQNLSVYWPMLFGVNKVAFNFLSHKVLRWLGPVFIAAAYLSSLFLIGYSPLYLTAFAILNVFLISPVLDDLLKWAGIELKFFRFISYFCLMNMALVGGFIMYIKGIQTSAWSPTKRNV